VPQGPQETSTDPTAAQEPAGAAEDTRDSQLTSPLTDSRHQDSQADQLQAFEDIDADTTGEQAAKKKKRRRKNKNKRNKKSGLQNEDNDA